MNCDTAITLADMMVLLRYVGGVLLQQPDCIAVGAAIFANGQARQWGDNNCSGAVEGADALYDLLNATGEVPTPAGPCPHMGDVVSVHS